MGGTLPPMEPILVGVAWPYPNGEKHIGQIAGAYLPPDIFARFQRMRGRNVLMVSGSDTHGTPITLAAEAAGLTPMEVVERYHALFVDGCLDMGLTFDLFTHTDTDTHWATTHQMFTRHLAGGYLYTDVQSQLFDPVAGRFLPDRYVEGVCPHCGYPEARGDQCDDCGRLYEATELGTPRSKLTGSTDLEVRDTEHFFLDLAKLNQPLRDWMATDKEHWRPNVRNFTLGQLELGDLRGRPITRDIEWGVTIPVAGYEDKRIYVWYDAVIGYLSAAREWAALSGDPEAWRRWWDASVAPEARIYNFIGKDNIPFHTIIWPGMLIGYGAEDERLNLPWDVPSNEYLNLGGSQFSTSRGNVIGFNTVLDAFQPDAWRYVLTALAPETNDVEFTWDDFVERVNNELVANWGNLVNRVLGFAARRYDGRVPVPGPLDAVDESLLEEVRAGFETVAERYEAVHLRAALVECRRLGQRVNQYLNEKAPWTLIKTDEAAAATAVWVALQAIDWLRLLWAPILPHASEELHRMLGRQGSLFGRQYTEQVTDARGSHLVLRYDHAGAIGIWEPGELAGGTPLGEPVALFEKLDPADVTARLG